MLLWCECVGVGCVVYQSVGSCAVGVPVGGECGLMLCGCHGTIRRHRCGRGVGHCGGVVWGRCRRGRFHGIQSLISRVG
jgi:hypothetical protein